MRVMGEVVVAEMRVGQNDRRDIRRRRVVREHAGYVAQDPLGDQVGRGPLRGVPREVRSIWRRERHAEAQENSRAIMGGDLDTHAAYLVPSAVDDVARGDYPLLVDVRCRAHTSVWVGQSTDAHVQAVGESMVQGIAEVVGNQLGVSCIEKQIDQDMSF